MVEEEKSNTVHRRDARPMAGPLNRGELAARELLVSAQACRGLWIHGEPESKSCGQHAEEV